MATAKTQVVSVRLKLYMQAALRSAAQPEMHSLANMMVAYCRSQGYPVEGVPDETLANPKQ